MSINVKKIIDVNRCPEGTPERTFLEFAKAWQDRDFGRMLDFCQKTWLETNHNATIGNVSATFRGLDLLNLVYVERLTDEEMNKKGLNPEVIADLKVCVKIKVGKKCKTKLFLPRLVKESGPYIADPNGQWGINPVSAFKVFKR